MKKDKPPEVWVIRDKTTKKLWVSPQSGKGSWGGPGYAKNAWNLARRHYNDPVFDKDPTHNLEVVQATQYAEVPAGAPDLALRVEALETRMHELNRVVRALMQHLDTETIDNIFNHVDYEHGENTGGIN